MDLHAAARAGDVAVLNAGVASGCDVNAKDKLSRTPLHLAAWSGQTDAVRLLLAAGALAAPVFFHYPYMLTGAG